MRVNTARRKWRGEKVARGVSGTEKKLMTVRAVIDGEVGGGEVSIGV